MERRSIFKYSTVFITTSLVIIFMLSSLLLINIKIYGIEEDVHQVNYFQHERQYNKGNEFKKRIPLVTILGIPTSKLFLNNTNDPFKTSYINSGSTAICSFIKTCSVSCKGGILQEVIEEINALIRNDIDCTAQYITLQLTTITLPAKTISSGWLKDLTVGVQVLKIISTDLEELGESAFSGQPFGSNPLSLTLTDTNIKELRKSTFTGSSIYVFEIKFGSMRQSIKIEENALGDTSYSVQSISINYCLGSGDALKNLTGKGDLLAGLKTLELSYNMITKLESDTFLKAPNLEQLYLTSIGLSEIEVGAFKGLSKISQLFINRNNLRTLSPGVFDDLDGLLSLYSDNNPWSCTCEMQWFKEYLRSLPPIDYRRCKDGSEWVDMEDIEFCPINSTSTSSTKQTTKLTAFTSKMTETPAIIPTTSTPVVSNDFIFERILCRNLLSYPFENITDDDAEYLLVSTFKRRNNNFTIIEIGSSLTYRIDLTGEIKSTDFLIWTNVENRSDYGCIYNINGHILLTLQFQNTYTVCFSSKDPVDTYALIADDCTAIATPAEWDQRAWLRNRQKTVVVLSIVLTFVITLAVASSAVYYLVKYNPELIKGNKRVLIVKRGSYSPNVLVMPSRKETVRHVSLCTNNEGYLTPKFKRWSKNKFSDLRYQELETISDNNIGDGSGDKMIRTDPYIDEKANEQNLYEPPPLPPNHPSRRRDSGRPYFYSNM